MKYNVVICGGTFDRLHAGHKAFLRFAFAHGKTVIIGITSDAYVGQHKKNEIVLPFSQREKEVKDFLADEGFLERATIAAIDSKFDQTQIPEEQSVALLVTPDTQSSGIEINNNREKKGFSPLPLLMFPLVTNNNGNIR